MENSPTKFFCWKPNVDKYLWIRTFSRGENWREVWIRPCRWFPQHEHFSRSTPLHCFHVFSRLMTCQRVITLFLQTLAFYYVDDVKIHTSEHMKDLGSHFLKTAFGPSVWIQIHINIDFTKFGATTFIISFFATPVGCSFDTPAYRGQSCWANWEGLIAFMCAL